MPLDLDRCIRVMSKISIRDRDDGSRVFMHPRPQQMRVLEMFKEHLGKKRRLFGIFLKARRVGISTLINGIQVCHIASKPDSHAAIIAQTKEVSKELFKQASGFARDLRAINPTVMVKNNRIEYPFPTGVDSDLCHHTAATIHGTRGLTLSSVHMTEAAFYPYEGAYKAILNTISSADPDAICMIETTANGMEGPGESYYQYWNDAVRGDNEFLPIFLPWYEDEAYISDPESAKDAPADDYEKWLMRDLCDWKTGKKLNLGKDRIAWYRTTLATKCEGSIDVWRSEYPSTAEEAFVASGNPAFSHDEMKYAESCVRKPLHYGMVELNAITGLPQFRPSLNPGPDLLHLFEMPKPGNHYFAGIDTARGNMENKNPGDFASIVVWNAESGEMAARYAARVSPEVLSGVSGLVGRFYNNACLNVEINNLGYVVMKELRERHYYPNQYRWKGRDDKFDGKPGTAYGFETTQRSRSMMFNLFRMATYRKEVSPLDKEFVSQMSAAKMEAWRWSITVGHDDIFMAGLLGWIAKEQFHPLRCAQSQRTRNLLLTPEELIVTQMALTGSAPGAETARLTWDVDPSTTAFGALMYNANDHLRKLERYGRLGSKSNRLEGI